MSKFLPIVGIGASAGGLKALKEFFNHVPDNSGLAYVVVVHLSPEHKSMLAELLQSHVNMPVKQVSETQELKPNNVYVIPPNANLNTVDTHLRLSKLEQKRSERAPIDHFFRTLAKTHNGTAMGIILTGTGSDGTLGIKAIKEAGGLTIVQNPAEAEYDGMPKSALATGIIDLVLTLAEIPEQLISFSRTSPNLSKIEKGEKTSTEEEKYLQKIFTQIRVRTGRDFTSYKVSTLLRRIARRMQIYRIEDIQDYLEFLRKNPTETVNLSDDFLINVTRFFRDPEAFGYLSKYIIPKIFQRKSSEDQVRIWSIGCATGEEAYSLSILFSEALNNLDHPPSIQIFASDLHEQSLQKAR